MRFYIGHQGIKGRPMVQWTSRRATRGTGAILHAVVLSAGVAVTALAPAGASVRTQTKLLGTKNPAKGTPVKIGLITDDKTASTDNSIETPVANAATQWINEYRGGIGGHPMELVRCVSGGEPGKSTDCANQMVGDKGSAVILGSNQFTLNIWQILHAAGIPVFIFATGNPDLLADPTSTFVFGTGSASTTGLAIGAAKTAKPKAKKVTVI